MSREEMIEKIKNISKKYAFDEMKQMNKEIKKIFGLNFVGCRPTGAMEWKYTIMDDENDACYIYVDMWNGIVE